MNSVTRLAAINKFRTVSTILRQPNMKVLVVYDILLKGGESPHIPLVINYGKSDVCRPVIRKLNSCP